jgi:Rrf2 family iron-sulfur cluster assembly transcriptional regulator
MRITAVEEYGLRCLLALARQGQGKQLSIPDIAEMEGLSVPYVSKLLAILRKAGLLTAERGRSGGFSISRPLDQISVYEVLVVLGGPLIDPAHCQKHTGQLDQCIHLENCSVHDVLGGLAGYVKEFLSQTTLQDLAYGHPLLENTPQKIVTGPPTTCNDLKQIEGFDPSTPQKHTA